MAAHSARKMCGDRGTYQLRGILQHRKSPLDPIWLAESGSDFFVLKSVPKSIASNYTTKISPILRQSPFIRLPHDFIREQSPPVFVYNYLKEDLLDLACRQLSCKFKKTILRSVLEGLHALHEQDIIHLDIKPDNILVDISEQGQEPVLKDVKIIDLENAAHCPPGRCIKGMLAGNDNWRCPEGHFKGELSKPADIFAFGAVCIYTMLGRTAFGEDEDFRMHQAQGALPTFIRLQRQVSYFGDSAGINGLSKHVGDEEENCQILQMLWEDRDAEHIPYVHFSKWSGIDPLFANFIIRLMNLDPAQRMTAQDALQHPWMDSC